VSQGTGHEDLGHHKAVPKMIGGSYTLLRVLVDAMLGGGVLTIGV